MNCPKCGTEANESKFCPECGAPTQEQLPGQPPIQSEQPQYQPPQSAPPQFPQQPQYQQPTIVINNTNTNTVGGFGNGESAKSKMVTLILCIFFGVIGIHRFYVGKVGSGVLYAFTGGVCGVGVILDFIKILTGTFSDGAGLPIRK
jgi:Predicted membrane protein